MKLKLFLIAASAMALASCSSDEVVQSNENANAIQFSVVANNASRAADYWCNNSKPNQFNVWAAVDGKTYFANESYSKQGEVWAIDGNLRYWPDASTNVSFYAAKVFDENTPKNQFATVTWKPDGGSTIAMKTDASASKQNDLLYAYTVQHRPDAGGKVPMNFRHALSQIVFYAQNLNENIYVTIDEVVVCNINSVGTFTFPTTVTDTPVTGHKQEGDLGTVAATSVGKWTSTTPYSASTDVFTPVALQQIKITGEGESAVRTQAPKSNLTDNTTESSYGNSLLLIPQHVDAWDATSASKKAPAAEGQTGAYFKVKCTIQNVAAGDGTAAVTGDVYLWGASGATKYIYLPVEINWETGKKYIYTFKFLPKGHGGYEEDGDEVLIPIEFDVTVDDFAKSSTDSNTDVNIDE